MNNTAMNRKFERFLHAEKWGLVTPTPVDENKPSTIIGTFVFDTEQNREIYISAIHGTISVNKQKVFSITDAAAENVLPFKLSGEDLCNNAYEIVHDGKTITVNGEQIYPQPLQPE